MAKRSDEPFGSCSQKEKEHSNTMISPTEREDVNAMELKAEILQGGAGVTVEL